MAWRFLAAYVLAAWAMLTIASSAFLFSSFVENAIGPIIGTMGAQHRLPPHDSDSLELFKDIKPYLFTNYLNVWQKMFEDPVPWQSIGNSTAVLGAYSLGLFCIAWLIFRRKDILYMMINDTITNGRNCGQPKRSLQKLRDDFHPTFWVANGMELFERLAYYGQQIVFMIYMRNKLGFTESQAGQLSGMFGGLIYLLPILGGTLADKWGFRRAFNIAFTIFALGYFLIGSMGMTAFAGI